MRSFQSSHSRQLLYHFDQVFSHASRPKKSLTQNVFLLIYLIFLVFFLTFFFQMCEHLVEMVQYCSRVLAPGSQSNTDAPLFILAHDIPRGLFWNM
jgi:hypothetical protein